MQASYGIKTWDSSDLEGQLFSVIVGASLEKLPAHVAMVQGEEWETITSYTWEDAMAPFESCKSMDTNVIFSIHNQVRRHGLYPRHYSGMFVPKNAQNAETKHQSRAAPILLLANCFNG